MSLPRPLPKNLLKKMYMKTLYEHKRPGGRYNNVGSNYGGILRYSMPEFFNIPNGITEEELSNGTRAVFELERDGYIMQDHSQSETFKILTNKGKKVVEQKLEDMELPSIDIDQLLTQEDLKNKVQDEFLEGDYETAIFKAYKLLEEKVRIKAIQPYNIVGADLMSKAFNPNNGILNHPEAQTAAEKEGLHHLMRGAIMWFKNPSSHRTVGYDKSEQTAHVLAFANFLLDMVEQC